MSTLLAAITWDPGFRGLFSVGVGVIVLCGSAALIMATNSGVRLGFLVALTGLFSWLFIMGAIWAMYGIGYLGRPPTWELVDVVRGEPSQSVVDVAESLPLPEDLPDPVELRDASEELTANFPPEQRDPRLSELITIDEDLRDRLNEDLAPWSLLEISNRYTGETQSVVAEELGPNGQNIFPGGGSDYVVLESYLSGGKRSLGEDTSILNRVRYKITSPFDINHAPFRAAVQLQPVIPQEPKAGQAPPPPVADPDAPVYTVILERDRGTKRLPATVFTVACGLGLAVCAWMLHSRDKLAAAQRAATGAA